MWRRKYPGGWLVFLLLFCSLSVFSQETPADESTVGRLLKLKAIFAQQQIELQMQIDLLQMQADLLQTLQTRLTETRVQYQKLTQSSEKQEQLIADLKTSMLNRENYILTLRRDLQALQEALDASGTSLQTAQLSLTAFSQISRDRVIKAVFIAGCVGLALGIIGTVILSALLPAGNTASQ